MCFEHVSSPTDVINTVYSLEKLQDSRDHLCYNVHGGILVAATQTFHFLMCVHSAEERFTQQTPFITVANYNYNFSFFTYCFMLT